MFHLQEPAEDKEEDDSKSENQDDEADGPPEVSDEVSGLTSYHWAA